MTTAFTCAVSLLLTIAGPPSALRSALIASGYSAIPLQPQPGGGMFLVRCEYAGHNITLGLDTGASAFAVLDDAVAKRIGLKSIGHQDAQVAVGSRKMKIARLPSLTVSGFPTDGGYVLIDNVSELNGPLPATASRFTGDGLLGHRCLEMYDGVIDYPGQTLYLRQPGQTDLARLAGEWAVSRSVREGVTESAQRNATESWRIAGDRLRIRVDNDEVEFNMTLNDRSTPKKLDLWQSLPDGTRGGTTASYYLSGDELSVCIVIDPGKVVRPTIFRTHAGSGTHLLEFRRIKPRGP